MKKVNYFAILATVSLIFFIRCGSDDSSPDEVSATILELERETTTAILTGGNNGVWKISEANLVNSSGSFTISNNFNVVDDEFIFSGSAAAGTLQWRQGNAINVAATSIQESLMDYYKSPENYSNTFIESSSKELTSMEGRFEITVLNAETINGVISFSNGEKLNISLSQKLAGDYATAPSSTLSFSQLTTVQDNHMYGEANVGITGSYVDNSLYIANRSQIYVSGNHIHNTRKLNIDTNEMTTNVFEIQDFYTKRAHVINNELLVFGGSYIYKYDLNLSADPTLVEHGLGGIGISRFGSASVNDDIYIVGGDLDELESDRIIKYNQVSGTISDVGLLPGPKTHAGAEIVDDKLYVFSGRQQFAANETVETTSYIYDLTTGASSSFDVPRPMMNTYASRFQNLIFVCGDVWEDNNGDGNVDNFEIEIGVYDTSTNTYSQLEHDIDDSDAFSLVTAMTVFNGKMYVIYGDPTQPSDPGNGEYQTWQILSANLN